MKTRLFYLPLFFVVAYNANIASAADALGTQHSWLGPQLLYSTYEIMQPRLESNAFGEPFYLKAQVFKGLTTGDVYAILPYAYDLIAKTLIVPQQFCRAMLLHINVKGCVVEAAQLPKAQMDLYIGKKEYQNPENAVKVSYEFSVANQSQNYTLISLIADKGPLNTEDIAIHLEFAAINNNASFIHFNYSAKYGSLARFALNTYLATIGRHKVGFSTTGVDKLGDPVYVKGIEGVVERNTMRYFFALESYFDTAHIAERSRFEASLNRWFDYVEKYPKQLFEVPRDDYVEAKHKELTDTLALQADSNPL